MERLRLILLDDEYIILEGLQKTYRWEEMGYQVVGAYTSAEAALEELSVTQPQVVLTDIRMREIDGLEFLRQVREEYPSCLGILISAYKDFEYAKRACELGAFSYLPKPFEDSQLEEIMQKAHDAYCRSMEERRSLVALRRLMQKGDKGFVNSTIERYAKGLLEDVDMADLLYLAKGREEESLRFVCIMVDIDPDCMMQSEVEYEALRFGMVQVLERALEAYYPLFSFAVDTGAHVFVADTTSNPGTERIKEVLSGIKREQERDMVSAVSMEYPGVEGIRRSFEQAKRIFEFAGESGAGLFLADQTQEGKPNGEYPEKIEIEIISAIRKNDMDALKDAYRRFIFAIPDGEGAARIFLLRLALKADFYMHETYGGTESMNNAMVGFYQMAFSVIGTKAVDHLYRLLCRMIKEREQHYREYSSAYLAAYMEQALSYIELHYHEETLSINDVATEVFLNPVYFGRVFKQNMGISFRRYLTNVRMDHATELLRSGNHNVVEVCERVGIGNPSYFTQIFKKHTGKLPSEFASEA